MKSKQIIRISVDLLMTILLLLLMAFMLTGQEAHEWLGAGMLALFIIHHVLNAAWLKGLGQGSCTPFRILQTVLALLVLLAMLGSMASGIMMSRYVFDFLPIRGGMAFARTLHMLCAYWGFLFLSAHLGLHWGMMMGMVRKMAKVKTASLTRRTVLRILACGISVYGVYVFFEHRISDYLFLRSIFVFFDFEQPPIQFFAEYIAMMGLWICVAYYLSLAVRKLTRPASTAGKNDSTKEGSKPCDTQN